MEPPTAGALLIEGEDVAGAGGERGGRCGATCRWCSRTPTARSTRARRSAARWRSRCSSTPGCAPRARRAAARAMMAKVGLRPEHYHRYPHMFSGGQRQRIAIARALMLQAQHRGARRAGLRARRLDPGPGAEPDRGIAGELGLAYVFISHDLSVVRHIADEVMVIYLGAAVEIGAKASAVRDAAAPLHAGAAGGDAGRRPATRARRARR